MSCNKCNKCEDKCGNAKPILEVVRKTSNSLVLRFNVNGVQYDYDFTSIIDDGQTDTSLSVQVGNRILQFLAERHTDTISAEELGAILHLADIGDVDTNGVEQGSTLVYQKNNDCASGCVGTNNMWKPWNALDNVVQNADYVSVFDADGNPLALGRPQSVNQFYNLGWNANGKLSYQQPSIATAKRPGDYTLYMRSDTREIYAVQENN